MVVQSVPQQMVAIGGLGGSGTRIAAQILQKLDFYIGPTLNLPLDNLLFTLLFKRHDWIKEFPSDAEICGMIDLFSSAMRDGVGQAFEHFSSDKIENMFSNVVGNGINSARFKDILASPAPDMDLYSGMAWKEPNTHVFLPQFMQRFPQMKYIHVIRNGLDMALSGNRQQLTNWGRHYGIEAGDAPDTRSQLNFWLAANLRAIKLGQEMKSGHFYLLNFDDLCLNFETEVRLLEDFLVRKLSEVDIDNFVQSIGSSSIGRFRNAPPNTFSSSERKAVQALGFVVD
ncbi:MAG: hypothetical protein ACI82I_001393 [Gammaproteobacteria bacterium]|jgi:hypothetical protein